MTDLIKQILANAEKALSISTKKPESDLIDAVAQITNSNKEFLNSKLSVIHVGGNRVQHETLQEEGENSKKNPGDITQLIEAESGYYPDLDEAGIYSNEEFAEFESAFELNENDLFDESEIIESVELAKPKDGKVEDPLTISQNFSNSIDDFLAQDKTEHVYLIPSPKEGGAAAEVSVSDANNSIQALIKFATNQLSCLALDASSADQDATAEEQFSNDENHNENVQQTEELLQVVTNSDIETVLSAKIAELSIRHEESVDGRIAEPLSEKFTYLVDGVELDKYPKEYAKEQTTYDKRSKWFITALESVGVNNEELLSLSKILSDAHAAKVDFNIISTLGCLALFNNQTGAFDDQRKRTKEELASIERAESERAHKLLLEKALSRVKEAKEIEKINQQNNSVRNTITSVLTPPDRSLNELISHDREMKFQKEPDPVVEHVDLARAELLNAFLNKENGDKHFAILDGLNITLRGVSNSVSEDVIQKISDASGQVLIWAKSSDQIDRIHEAIKHFSQKDHHDEKLLASELKVENLNNEIQQLATIVKEIRDGLKGLTLSKPQVNQVVDSPFLNETKSFSSKSTMVKDRSKFDDEIEKGIRKLNLSTNDLTVNTAKPVLAPEVSKPAIPASAEHEMVDSLELRLLATVETKVLELIKKSIVSTQNRDAVKLYLTKSDIQNTSKIKEAVLVINHFNSVYHVRVDESGRTLKMNEASINVLNKDIAEGKRINVSSPSFENMKNDAIVIKSNATSFDSKSKVQNETIENHSVSRLQSNMSP